MLETIKNAFKTPEIRKKLLYVLFALIVVRVGCQLPIPGINNAVIKEFFDSATGAAGTGLGFLDVMTGGSFSKMSIFALNITPYITASIICLLYTSRCV